jgi:transposase InsO family protein
VIKNNIHKYSVSGMCRVLKISRSTYYYESVGKIDETEISATIIDIFKSSRNNYGTRKIKIELMKKGYVISRRRIARIMKEEGLAFNNHRIHSSLGYLTPYEYKIINLKKSV